jgi:hypothetical protein
MPVKPQLCGRQRLRRWQFKARLDKTLQDTISANKQGKVEHVCNPDKAGGGDRRIVIEGQSRQKCEILSKK